MKRTIVIAIVLLVSSILHAQDESGFYRHEIRASLGESMTTSYISMDKGKYTNISVSYFYRPVNFIWAGLNFVNYLGENIHYYWREYDTEGNHKDFIDSKMKYCAIIAPEIRLSCLNKEAIIIYGGLSIGIGIENGFDDARQKYPDIFRISHLTIFGISGNLGKKNNVIIGGELGYGFKGLCSIHCGYRF